MNRYLVELVGTLFVTYIVFATGNYLAIGAAFALATLLGGPISGAAYNPAISIALMYSGRLRQSDLVPYILAQIAGALAGYQLFRYARA